MEDEDSYLYDQPLLQKAVCREQNKGHTHITAMLGGHILMGLLNQHSAPS